MPPEHLPDLSRPEPELRHALAKQPEDCRPVLNRTAPDVSGNGLQPPADLVGLQSPNCSLDRLGLRTTKVSGAFLKTVASSAFPMPETPSTCCPRHGIGGRSSPARASPSRRPLSSSRSPRPPPSVLTGSGGAFPVPLQWRPEGAAAVQGADVGRAWVGAVALARPAEPLLLPSAWPPGESPGSASRLPSR